jgi:predicted Zn-dependent peptidase
MYKFVSLENGLQIVTHSMPKMRSVAVGIWIRVGGRYESAENKGISHYLEHMLFKGSQKYSCRKIKESIEGVGGALNGFTSEELTCYLAKLPAQHVDVALHVLSDMVMHPRLSKIEIDKERTVILEELKMYKDLPQSYVYELLDGLLWPGQPLGMSIIGTEESLHRLHRKDLSAFQKSYYSPAHMVVSVTGLIDYQDVVERIQRVFVPLKRSAMHAFSPVKEQQSKPRLKIFFKETEQTHLAMGFHGFKRNHPLRYAVSLLHVILGGNMSSRLFNEVREHRGLAYEIGTQVKRYQDTGAFLVHAGIDNRKVLEALDVIQNELGKAKKALVSSDELRRAKDFFIGQLMLALEDTMDHMLWMGETVACGDKLHTLEEIIRDVKKVTATDIRSVARELFTEGKLNVAIIGPLRDEAAIHNTLHIT